MSRKTTALALGLLLCTVAAAQNAPGENPGVQKLRFIQDDTFHIQTCDLFHDAKLPCRTHAQGAHDIFLQELDLLFFRDPVFRTF